MDEIIDKNKEGQLEKIIEKEEGLIEKVAEELEIKMPKTREPFGVRIIALFILIGGLSLVGSAFTDIFGDRVTFLRYLLRTGTGIISIAIAYCLIKKMRWALWLYGLLILIGLFTNPVFSFFLLLILLYLIKNKEYFKRGVADLYFDKLSRKVLELYKD